MTSSLKTSRSMLERFASLALSHIDREYPSKLDHVLNGPDDLKGPRDLHPAFYGSFDWHSSVHAHWLLARTLRLDPDSVYAVTTRDHFDRNLSRHSIACECAYLEQPHRGAFERTYGWSWLLKLGAELRLGARVSTDFARWSEALRPLEAAFAARYMQFLPRATYPIRAGTHANSAFGVLFALEFARLSASTELESALVSSARAWFEGDADCQAWEPGGSDFLSPALMEAACMGTVLPRDDFGKWLGRFLPGLTRRQPATLFLPATVSDRTDGQIAHLDGLNLSRAWCFRLIAGHVAETDPLADILEHAANEHIAAALPHLAADYMGEHWLASFALLAISEGRRGRAADEPPKQVG